MNVIGIIQDAWAAEPRVMEACLSIWRGLSGRESHIDHYTFTDLQLLANESDLEIVSKALLYLSNPHLKVLKTCLMYEYRGGYFDLPDEEVARYSNGEGVIHPELGQPLPESEILIYFQAGIGLQGREIP